MIQSTVYPVLEKRWGNRMYERS